MTQQANVSAQTDTQAIKGIPNSDEAHSPEEVHEHPQPRGALMVSLIFLVVLITFWGYMYALLLLRGG